jgi:phosphopantothenoylcysteine decarboxylase/phosphopantothenate--cysteine ligase
MSEIVVGVCGGIAAYKTASLVRLFTESGNSVTVVPTASALKFVGAPTWEALSGRPVSSEVFESVDQVRHVKIGQAADLVVVAPTTANVLAKAAHGLADDLLTNTLLTTRGPVVFAPAMHTEMWENPATQANVHTLRQRGHVVLEPSIGRLTGVDTGKGRLPEPVMIFEVCRELLDRRQGPDLRGLHVVVSAGGTREYLDPVR